MPRDAILSCMHHKSKIVCYKLNNGTFLPMQIFIRCSKHHSTALAYALLSGTIDVICGRCWSLNFFPLQDEKYLNYSLSLYDWAWVYGWDDPCGGFYWSTCPGSTYKFNIELLEAMHLASKLAYTLRNETQYLKDAERLWNWFFSFDGGYGLMSDEYLVSTGAIPFGCCNATSTKNPCYNSRSHDSAYNQGLLLSSAAYLYLSTGNKSYIDVGIRAFEAIAENYTTKDGVLIDELRGFPSIDTYSCSAYSDPGGDWYSFNGVFMLHLGYFTELLVKNGSMPSDTLEKIRNFVQNTSDSAWSKSAVWPPFNQTNACKPGSAPVNKKAKHPKFHWWWGEKVEYDSSTPADPGVYFKKSQLRCYTVGGDDTQIWEGEVKSEDKCMQKCDRNMNCSKYLWQTYEGAVPGTNCWIWSYNRSNHICNLTDSEWNVGIKRPNGQASCAGKCGSTEPQKLKHGVCYCDTNCSKHLDCCLDYANECRAKQSASCKGHCNSVIAQPLFGGGYCWCYAGCNIGYYTGGSCCADYQHFCESSTVQPCLDGRTQGSALNLFLCHSMVSKVTKS